MTGASFRLLLRHEARRAGAVFRRAQVGALLGVSIPLALVVGALWAAAEQARFPSEGAEGAVLSGVLIAAVSSFLAYGVLFRPPDDGFLRRLGFSPRVLAAERMLRLLLLSLGAALLTLIPVVRLGEPLGRPLALAVGAAFVGWAFSVLAFGRAAYALGRGGGRKAPGLWRVSGGFDRELGEHAPLVYAPLVPLLGTAFVMGWVGAAAVPWLRVLMAAAASVLAAGLSLRWFAAALPRFAPKALEMAFDPIGDDHRGALVYERGAARLLPRRVALVRARDTLVGERRFGWATRIVWPVAIVSVVALARWGEQPEVRGWVGVMAGGVFLLQAAAVVGVGRLERGGRRWIDRSLGFGWAPRFTGRWAWAFGMAFWLLVPLSLAWGAWVPGQAGWVWFVVAGITGALAAAASLLAAGR
jgi:hypothetical protein